MLTAMGDVLREAHKRGWITTRDGNISLRRNGKFYITPSAGRKTIIHPEHIIKFSIENNLLQIPPDFVAKPSIELDMHWGLQRLHKGTRAVVHLHPTYTIAAMYAGLDLYQITKEFPELKRYTKIGNTASYSEPGSQDLAENVVKGLTRQGKLAYDIIGMDRHGVCAIGKSPWDAFEHIERLEHICQIVLASGRK
jgi:L-fuculose-phosphate aldolase